MSLSHINSNGDANMVDVSDKAVTKRAAKASGKVILSKEVLSLIHI